MSSTLPTAVAHLPDATTLAANITVGFAAIVAVVVGALSATKAIKKSVIDALKPEEATVTKTQVIGGVLQDIYGSQMLTQEVSRATQATNENTESNDELKHAVCSVRDELRENRHTMERLIDALRSNTNG